MPRYQKSTRANSYSGFSGSMRGYRGPINRIVTRNPRSPPRRSWTRRQVFTPVRRPRRRRR